MAAGVTLIDPDTVFLSADTQARPRRHDRAQRGLRPRRDGRRQRPHPRLLPHRGRQDRHGRDRRPVRPAAAGRGARRGRAYRQFRRGQGDDDSARAPRPTTWPISATPRSAPATQHRRRHDHLQLRRLQQAPHDDRRRRLHRLQHRAGRAGDGRRRRQCRRRQRDHRGRAGRRAGDRPRPPGDKEGRAGPLRAKFQARAAAAKRQKGREQGLECAASSASSASAPVAPLLVEALRRLEYRGYDSAGIATLVERPHRAPPRRGQARATWRSGSAASRSPARSASATPAGRRTARRPSATPIRIATDRVAVVHNGIIENFHELRAELTAEGRTFDSETDTEVVAHLVDRDAAAAACRPSEAVGAALARLRRRLRAGVAVRRRARPADRRAPRQPAGGRLWRRRDVRRLRRAGAGAASPAASTYLEDGDWAVVTRRRLHDLRRRGRPRSQREIAPDARSPAR